MTMRDPARMYRESAVRGASPVGLIVILYDEIVRSIRKAVRAFDAGDIEARGKALTHAVEVIGYLQSILDFEKGGDVARNLSNFYNLMRAQLFDIHITPTHERLEMMATAFARVAATWEEVERSLVQTDTAHDRSAIEATLQGASRRAMKLVSPLEASFAGMDR